MGSKHMEMFHAIIIQQYCNNSSKAQNNNKEVDDSPSKKWNLRKFLIFNDNKTIIHLALVRPGVLSSPIPRKPAWGYLDIKWGRSTALLLYNLELEFPDTLGQNLICFDCPIMPRYSNASLNTCPSLTKASIHTYLINRRIGSICEVFTITTSYISQYRASRLTLYKLSNSRPLTVTCTTEMWCYRIIHL